MASKTVGKNVSYEVSSKNILTITVDLNKNQGPSGSGKTEIIGTTQGNTKAQDAKENEFVFGVNVYKYADKE